MGGDEPKVITHKLKGNKGETYSIEDLSNDDYKILPEQNLEGVFLEDEIISIIYGGKTPIEILSLEKGTNIPISMPTVQYGYRGHKQLLRSQEFDGYKKPYNYTMDIDLEEPQKVHTFSYTPLDDKYQVTVEPSIVRVKVNETVDIEQIFTDSVDDYNYHDIKIYPLGVAEVNEISPGKWRIKGLSEGKAIIRSTAYREDVIYPAVAELIVEGE